MNGFEKQYRKLMDDIEPSEDARRKVREELRKSTIEYGVETPKRMATKTPKRRNRAFAAAVCVVLVALFGVLGASGLFGSLSAGDDKGNDFGLAMYEAYADETGQEVFIDRTFDDVYLRVYGLLNGYDLESETYRPENMYSLCNYGFDVSCVGERIDSITYELDGGDLFVAGYGNANNVWFEFSDERYREKGSSGMAPAFTAIPGEYDGTNKAVTIGLSCPLTEEEQALADSYYNDGDRSLLDELTSSTMVSNMEALSSIRIHVTAHFEDGSEAEKTYQLSATEEYKNLILADWSAPLPETGYLFTIKEI